MTHLLMRPAALALACLAFAPSPDVAAGPPNVLFIFLNDLGWRDTGFMGSDFYETPNLDRLAAEGMIFTDAYSCAANCAPARACLLSGQYTPRHQIYNVGTGPRGNAEHRRLLHVPGTDTLDPQIKTWAHRLREAGYATATMGKWHLSDDPLPYGFDLNIGGSHAGGPPQGYYPPHGKLPGLADAPRNEYVTDRLSDEAVKFIRRHKDRPWILYLTHFAVHTPLHAKKELLTKYEAKEKGRLHNHAAMATMIQAVEDGGLELYNLREDIGETTNLADVNRQQTQELLTRLETWRQQVQAPVPVEPNPAYDARSEAQAIEAKRLKTGKNPARQRRKQPTPLSFDRARNQSVRVCGHVPIETLNSLGKKDCNLRVAQFLKEWREAIANTA